MTKSKLSTLPNVAVIGSGYWGKNLVRNFHQIGALKLKNNPINPVDPVQNCFFRIESIPIIILTIKSQRKIKNL